MRKEKIDELRKFLMSELSNYKGEPIKLDLPSEILESILFFKDLDGRKGFNLLLAHQILKKINFEGISFDNFDCQSIDFRGLKGIVINPQKIYEKNLKGAILEGVTIHIDNYQDFYGVAISGANFKGAKLDRKGLIPINPQMIANKNLRRCVLDGVLFTGPFDDAKVLYANFSGSKDATIDVSKIIGKDLFCTVLKDTTVIGSFEGATIEGANFKGAIVKEAINPQTLANKKLNGCIFDGVTFNGSFDYCDLSWADFTGSKGAFIDDINSCKCEGTTFTDAKVISIEESLDNYKQKIKKSIHRK